MINEINNKVRSWLQLPDHTTKDLMQALDGFIQTPASFDLSIYHSAISQLSSNHHKKLESKACAVFMKVNKDTQMRILKSVCAHAIEHQNFESFHILRKIVSLDQVTSLYSHANLKQFIQLEAKITKKPIKQLDLMKENVSKYINSNMGIVSRAINYLAKTFFLSFSINFDKVPKNQQEASMQLYMVMGVVSSITTSAAYVSSLCTSALAITAVALGSLTLVAIGYLLYAKLKIGKPDNLNKNLFRNLNQEAQKNQLHSRTIGRTKELEELETALSAKHGDARPIPILIGPPGVGKSQLVEGLAHRISKGQSRALSDKQILMINSASLSGTSYSMEDYESLNRLEMIYRQLKGHEDDFILFFDEAHTLASISSAPFSAQGASLLEVLKSKLLEVPVQCIFATTDDEYQRSIAQDKAFVSRLKKIDLKPFTRPDAKSFLLQKYSFDQNPSVSEEVIEKVLDIIEEPCQDGGSSFNPRKAEHVMASLRNLLLAWRPQKLEKQLESCTHNMKALEENAKLKIGKNPSWLLSEEGTAFASQLNRMEILKASLESQIQKQTALIKLIEKIGEQIHEMTIQKASCIHIIADEESSKEAHNEALKQYLLINDLIIPSLKEALVVKKRRLKDTYDEEIPCDITASMVEKLYPTKVNHNVGFINRLVPGVFQNIKNFYQSLGGFFSASSAIN